MNIGYLLKSFREYERVFMGDRHDTLEWRKEFLEFVLWLADTGGLTKRAADECDCGTSRGFVTIEKTGVRLCSYCGGIRR